MIFFAWMTVLLLYESFDHGYQSFNITNISVPPPCTVSCICGCPFALWSGAISSRWITQENLNKQFSPVPHSPSCASALCVPVQLLSLGAVPRLGKLQRKWSVTLNLVGPFPGVDNGIELFQVSLGGLKLARVWSSLSLEITDNHHEVSLRQDQE